MAGLHCASKIGVSRVACCSAKNSVGFCFGLLELLMEGAGGLACADDEDDDELFQKMLGPLKVWVCWRQRRRWWSAAGELQPHCKGQKLLVGRVTDCKWASQMFVGRELSDWGIRESRIGLTACTQSELVLFTMATCGRRLELSTQEMESSTYQPPLCDATTVVIISRWGASYHYCTASLSEASLSPYPLAQTPLLCFFVVFPLAPSLCPLNANSPTSLHHRKNCF